MERWDRKQFYARLAPLDQDQLAKALWTVYWKGTKEVRQRIEAVLDPKAASRQRAASAPTVDPEWTLDEVTEFVALAKSGAYLGGDRRVRPRERTRWRFTLRRLFKDAAAALADADPEPGAKAMEQLLDLSRETGEYDYFRSEDPIEAARIVISDEVEQLWARLRQHLGVADFATRAAPQLLHWESAYGWTRRGDGPVAARERPLATVLEPLLPTRDSWVIFGERYLGALEAAAARDLRARRHGWELDHRRERRARDLTFWHTMLVEHLHGGDGEELLDRLVAASAIAGPDALLMRAELARLRGHLVEARQIAAQLVAEAPRNQRFAGFAKEIGTASAEAPDQ